jgi:hypothetical protein
MGSRYLSKNEFISVQRTMNHSEGCRCRLRHLLCTSKGRGEGESLEVANLYDGVIVMGDGDGKELCASKRIDKAVRATD